MSGKARRTAESGVTTKMIEVMQGTGGDLGEAVHEARRYGAERLKSAQDMALDETADHIVEVGHIVFEATQWISASNRLAKIHAEQVEKVREDQ